MKKDINRRKIWGRRMIATGVAVLALLALFEFRLRPVVEAVAEHQAKVYITRLVNDAVLEELALEPVSYDDLVRISKKDTGEVTAIAADMTRISAMKARIGTKIAQTLSHNGYWTVSVPMGTLSGAQLLSGRGPLVDIMVLPVGYVQTTVDSSLSSAGINQSLHEIMLNISINAQVIVSGYSFSSDVATNFCVAQTVIVGDVPQSFTQITGDDRPMISKINDYSDRNTTE